MLLKGARLVTYGAVLTSIGILMVLISIYTPFGRRLLFLLSGLPVLAAAKLGGYRASLAVFTATGLVVSITAYHPVKILGYLLIAGSVPALLSLPRLKMPFVCVLSAVFSCLYMWLTISLLGLPAEQLMDRLGGFSAQINPYYAGTLLVFLLGIVYPIGMNYLGREMERHWLYKELFKR